MPGVLHISVSDPWGGAAIASRRLWACQVQAGHQARWLGPPGGPVGEGLGVLPGPGLGERWLGRVGRRMGLDHVHLITERILPRHPWYAEAAVVHLHNLHGGFFNYQALPRLAREKILVWTLHDQWAFTGHCAYSYDCERWRTGCGRCPQLDVYPAMARDASAWEWRLRRRAALGGKMTVAAPSHWLTGLARESFLGVHPVHRIPYGLDGTIWQPMSREEARMRWGGPARGLLALLAAHDLTDRRKGADRLLEALRGLPESHRRKLTLITMGQVRSGDWREWPGGIRHLGYLREEADRRAAYSAADFLLFGSRADNLPLVLMEAMACGCPAAAFPVGGVPDLIQDGETGWLAPDDGAAGYSHKLREILEHPEQIALMGAAARRWIVNEFSPGAEIRNYSTLAYAGGSNRASNG